MPRVPGAFNYSRPVFTTDAAKGDNRSAKPASQVVKLPPPIRIPKSAAQKTAK